MNPHSVCWFDIVGDRLEQEGANPGNIFEFHFKIADDLHAGGIVETLSAPGSLPKTPRDIKRVIVKHVSGETIEMPPTRPVVLASIKRIIENLL